MDRVYLLWLNDSVLGVYGSERTAQQAALELMQTPEHRQHRWIPIGVKWWLSDTNVLVKIDHRKVGS